MRSDELPAAERFGWWSAAGRLGVVALDLATAVLAAHGMPPSDYRRLALTAGRAIDAGSSPAMGRALRSGAPAGRAISVSFCFPCFLDPASESGSGERLAGELGLGREQVA